MGYAPVRVWCVRESSSCDREANKQRWVVVYWKRQLYDASRAPVAERAECWPATRNLCRCSSPKALYSGTAWALTHACSSVPRTLEGSSPGRVQADSICSSRRISSQFSLRPIFVFLRSNYCPTFCFFSALSALSGYFSLYLSYI